MKANFNKNFKDFSGAETSENIAQTVSEVLFNHGTGTPAPENEKRMASIKLLPSFIKCVN